MLLRCEVFRRETGETEEKKEKGVKGNTGGVLDSKSQMGILSESPRCCLPIGIGQATCYQGQY
jgi:hypothetical protein